MVSVFHGETAVLRENIISVSQNQRNTQRSRLQGSEEAAFVCQTEHWISGRIYVGRFAPKTKGYPDDTYHLQTL